MTKGRMSYVKNSFFVHTGSIKSISHLHMQNSTKRSVWALRTIENQDEAAIQNVMQSFFHRELKPNEWLTIAIKSAAGSRKEQAPSLCIIPPKNQQGAWKYLPEVLGKVVSNLQ
jgi:hypothetical protein